MRWSQAILIVFLCAACSPNLQAQEAVDAPQSTATPRTPLAVALQTKGDLALQNTSIEKALFTIAASWNVNIVVGKEVTGTVSCMYQQTPLREVLDAILLANDYSYRAVGESLVVQRVQEVGSANPLFQSASIAVTHSDVDEVVEGAQMLLSQQGQLKPLPSARSILVVDFADRVERIREFVATMDAASARSTGGIPASSYNRLQVAYFHTQYVTVESAREPVASVLSAVGRVSTMPQENRLVVVDYGSNIEMVQKVLEKIDRPTPQVRITALIYDISLADLEQLGLNWNSVAKGNNLDDAGEPQQTFTFANNTLTPFAAGAAGGTATIRSLTRNFDITTVGLFLQTANDARLLANPNVTVSDNQPAVMSSVQEIPYQNITQSELGGQIGTTAFKPVGITLQVTPTVASDGTVKMIVQQTFSRVAGFTENDNQPIVDSRTANTTVRVNNRQTLVIGGLRQRSDTGEFNGIPILKDAWGIGPLFRSRDTNVREGELLVFLMPEIVGYDEAPSPREFRAQQTIECRLDRIPFAEGCSGPGGAGCTEGGYGELLPLPRIEENTPALEVSYQPLGAGEAGPLRTGYDNRFRAAPATTAQPPVTVQEADQSKPGFWNGLLQPKRK